jgi:hypothetical protein
MKRIWWILVCMLLATGTLAAQGVRSGNNNQSSAPNVLDYVISPNSVVFSRNFSEWDAEWQQWAYSIPVANHPLFDNGDCSVGQAGPVWFLGGKFCNNSQVNCSTTNVQRACTIPSGKFLYLPVYNGEDSALEESVAEHPGQIAYQQIGYMRQNYDAWAGTPPTYLASIDGVTVPDLNDYLVNSVVFGFTIPDDNYLKAIYPSPHNNFKAGTYYPAVDYGMYLMLAPLPVGTHVVHFGASWPTWGFDVTYTITVTK